jgi:hypothetical protein
MVVEAKQLSREHYSENLRLTKTNPTKNFKYQRGNQNPYIEEEQTTQWTKEKVQSTKAHQRSTKHTSWFSCSQRL